MESPAGAPTVFGPQVGAASAAAATPSAPTETANVAAAEASTPPTPARPHSDPTTPLQPPAPARHIQFAIPEDLAYEEGFCRNIVMAALSAFWRQSGNPEGSYGKFGSLPLRTLQYSRYERNRPPDQQEILEGLNESQANYVNDLTRMVMGARPEHPYEFVLDLLYRQADLYRTKFQEWMQASQDRSAFDAGLSAIDQQMNAQAAARAAAAAGAAGEAASASEAASSGTQAAPPPEVCARPHPSLLAHRRLRPLRRAPCRRHLRR